MTTPDELPGLLASLRERLDAAGARLEPLADYVPPRRTLGIPRAATARRRGRAWPLGVLLLGDDGRLYAEGRATRAKREARVGYVAESARERDGLRHAAARGGFREGEAVHLDPRVIDLARIGRSRPDEDPEEHAAAIAPLVVGETGRVLVRWASGTTPRPIAPYLFDCAELLGA